MDHLHELFGIEPGHPDSVFGLTLALRLRELETAAPVPRLMQYGGRVLLMAASVHALPGRLLRGWSQVISDAVPIRIFQAATRESPLGWPDGMLPKSSMCASACRGPLPEHGD